MDILKSKGDLNIDISGIAYDHRKIKDGYLFVCIEGTVVDGHSYIPGALENGAKALIVQRDVEVPEGITVIKVSDARFALASISDSFFGHPSGKFDLVGITGTKGKTTTSYMIKSILENYGRKVGLIGTISNLIANEVIHTDRTTPESYDLQSLFSEMVDKDVQNVVMEVSSQGLALNRVACCEYDIGVFTNISRDHIGPKEHIDFDDYLSAKAILFRMCKRGLINIDAAHSEKIIKSATCQLFTYAIDNEADIKATNVIYHQDCVEFDVLTLWGENKIKVNIPGKFTVYNTLAALGTCCLMGIPFENIKKGLESISVPGRAEVVETGKEFTVMVDYAHTPDSLENILTTVKGFSKGRVVCVFGCGGDRDRAKRPMMGELSGKIADFTIITSDNPRTEEPLFIIGQIEEGIKKVTASYITIVDRKEAIKYAIENAHKNDVIVIAGKGHEPYQIFKNETIHFDDREVAREILKSIK